MARLSNIYSHLERAPARCFFEFVTTHPAAVLWVCGLWALTFGVFVLRLTRDTDPDAFIPSNLHALILKEQVDEDFGLTDPIAVAVIRDAPGGIFSADTLRLIQDLTEAIKRLPGVEPEDVLSIATESGVFFSDGEPGFELLMDEIPETAEGIEALAGRILGYELYRGTLVAEDRSASCIVIRSEGKQSGDAIYRELSKLVKGFPVRDERIVVAGEAAVRAHMGVAVSDDALRMNFVCPVVMALMIVLVYRTGRGTVLPLWVIGGASVTALGLMAACAVPVYIVTNGIFVIIMALGVADSLHLLGQYYEEQLDPRGRSRQQIVVDACMALWFPVLVTSLTDVAGFLALYIVGIMPPIRFFGLFTCFGILGALIYSYTVIPASLMVLPLRGSKAFVTTSGALRQTAGALDFIGRSMGRLGELTLQRSRLVLGVGGVLVAVAVWGASKLVINDARILAFKDDHLIVQASNELNARFDGTSQLNIVVTAEKESAMLQADVLRRIEALEAFTETLPKVGGTHSIAGWVKRAHQKMHDEDPAFYAIPDNELETAFYLDTLSMPGAPMARSLLEVVDKSYTRANLIVRMTNSEFIHQRHVVDALDRYLERQFNRGGLHAVLAGRVNLDYHWLKIIRKSHINSVCFSFACVLVLTSLMFRSVVAGLLCALTVGMAVLVNYAVMGLAGIPLGIGTSMFASIAIGAGVNAPIHILDRLRVSMRVSGVGPVEVFRNSLGFTGRALFFTALIVAVGFLLLVVSQFQTLVRFGLLVGISMIVSFLTSVTLLPAAVALLKPRFVWRHKALSDRAAGYQEGPDSPQRR
ncbi:MAG: efflux RND transporter permease subunit [Planctomycetota bacterium]